VRVESILEGLNPEQRRAVETTEGPLLILAGAGSGKTRVLTHRIAYLVGVCGIPAESILAVTFTNKAAGEMRERVEKLLGPGAGEAWVSTFHSTCVRILRRDIGHLGYSRGFVIYDDTDSRALVKESLRRHGLDPKSYDPKRYRWRIDQWKNAGVSPSAAADSAGDLDLERAAEIYATYQRLLVDANALDFGDLLLKTTELFARFPEVLAYYRRRWQYVLVDEYQDTNRVQYDLVHQIASEHRNLCVVGDPDQSIYAWRGADIRNIMDFERDNPDAAVVALERNYRSTQPILSGASAVVSNNSGRRGKRLFTDREGGERIRVYEARDDRDEAQFVVRGILGAVRDQGRSNGDCAIFYRTNAQSRLFEEELLKYDVPYIVVGGVRFYDRAEVKDALAYLRLLVNPADGVSFRRVINRPVRGIGRLSIERADLLAQESGATLIEGARRLAAGEGGGRVPAKLGPFLELLDALRAELLDEPPAAVLTAVLDRSGYGAALEREGTPEAETRIENLRELVAAADDFSRDSAGAKGDDRSDLEIFLDQVALVSDLDGYDRRDESVSLMTAHSAKGLEFPIVYLVGMEEGIFPHAAASTGDRDVEEERRLCYVGMTRAMESLTLTCARERRRFGTRSFGVPSRFLREIPADAVDEASSSHVESGPSLDYTYSQDQDDDPIAAGLRVIHPVFGRGTIESVVGTGLGRKLKIRFERAGVKTIVMRYANLELG